MSSVFDLIFDIFESVVGFLKDIPLTSSISLYDFSLAILILSITAVALIPVVRVGSFTVNENVKAYRAISRSRRADKNSSAESEEI